MNKVFLGPILQNLNGYDGPLYLKSYISSGRWLKRQNGDQNLVYLFSSRTRRYLTGKCFPFLKGF